jgi:hypothetical protein
VLGAFAYGTASSGSGTGTGQITVSAFQFKSSTSSDVFTDKFVYRPEATLAADKDRMCALHTPSTGVLTTDLAWSDDPDGEVIELLAFCSGSDVNRLVNEALQYCFTTSEFSFTVSNASANRHNLTDEADWLTNPAHVYQIGSLGATQDRDEVDPYENAFVRGRAVVVDGSVYAVGPRFSTGQTVYVQCIRSLYSLCCASGGTPGDQSGLSNEDDECLATSEQIRWAVVWRAMDELLAQEQNPAARQVYAQRRAEAILKFNSATRRTGFKLPRRTFVEPASMAATPGGSW